MEAQKEFILRILTPVKPSDDELVRIMYPSVIGKNARILEPRVSLHKIEPPETPWIIENAKRIKEEGKTLVLVFRIASPTMFKWDAKNQTLEMEMKKKDTFEEWMAQLREYRDQNWADSIKFMSNEYHRTMHHSIETLRRPSAEELPRALLLERLCALQVAEAFEVTHVHNAHRFIDANKLLEMMYELSVNFGQNPPPEKFYTQDEIEMAELECREERDKFCLYFAENVIHVKCELLKKVIDYFGYHRWWFNGYQYPPFYRGYGKTRTKGFKDFVRYYEDLSKRDK